MLASSRHLKQDSGITGRIINPSHSHDQTRRGLRFRVTRLPSCALRCNGSLPSGDKGRRKSRFALCRRTKANGVKPSTVHSSRTPQAAKVSSRPRTPCRGELRGQVCFPNGARSLQAVSNKEQHSVSYTLSRAHTVVVVYAHDGGTDMFQVRTTWKVVFNAPAESRETPEANDEGSGHRCCHSRCFFLGQLCLRWGGT